MKYSIPVILSAALVLSGCTSNTNTSSNDSETKSENQVGIGMSLPSFNLASITGDSVSSESLKGKIIVIHIATTWCPYCNAEAPNLEKLYQKYQDQGVEVIILDVKETDAIVQEKLQDRFNFSFPLLMDKDGSVSAMLAPDEVLPDLPRDEIMIASNIIVDRSGKVQYMSLLDTKNFDAQLIELEEKLIEML